MKRRGRMANVITRVYSLSIVSFDPSASLFADMKSKPHIIEEHDSVSNFISAIEAIR